jgi:hypothetical protein
MKKLININAKAAVLLYVLVDFVCAAVGMGVPVLCIALGFPLGWYLARRVSASEGFSRQALLKILRSSFAAAAFTLILMLGVWGWTASMLFDPATDFENFGHPFILYDPKPSFIAWLVLMIFISPSLQLLTTVFTAFLTLAARGGEDGGRA